MRFMKSLAHFAMNSLDDFLSEHETYFSMIDDHDADYVEVILFIARDSVTSASALLPPSSVRLAHAENLQPSAAEHYRVIDGSDFLLHANPH